MAVMEQSLTEQPKTKRVSKIEQLIAPHSYQAEFVECLANIEKKYGFELFQMSGIGKQLDVNWFAKQFFGRKTNTADVSVDSNSNVGLKNTVIFDQEMSKPLKLIYSYYRMWKGLKKKFGLEYANEAVKKQLTGEIYINDFHGFASNLYYCYNYSTLDTARKGIPVGIDAEKSRPTKYLGTFLEHLQLFCIHAGSSSLGAVGLADLLLTISAYANRVVSTKSDHKAHFASEEDCWVYIRAKLRNFIYFLNQPNRIVQSLFSNVSLYDDHFLDTLVEYYFIEDGDKIYFAEKDIVKKLQGLFMDVMNEAMSERIVTFPVVTACFSLDEERNVQEPDFLKWVLESDKKYRFVNLYGGSTSTLSSCCFDKNQMVLAKSSNSGVIFDTFKNIEEMKPYDDYKKNFTIYHNGSWVRGNLVKVPRGDKKLYKVITMNNKEINVTEDHINVTLDGDKSTTELTTNDYLAFSNRKLDAFPEKDNKLTYEQGYVVGLYLGDGSKYKRKDCEGYEVTFSLNESNKPDLDTIRKALEQLNVEKELHIHWQHNVMLTKVYSKELYDFLNTYVLGDYAYEKEINMQILLQSYAFRKGIVDGWYASDGGNSLRIYTTSEKLIPQADALFSSLGINTIINVTDRTGTLGEIRGETFQRNYPTYCIRWYDMKNKRSMGDIYKVRNNTEYFKIKSIEEIEYNDDYVYCFSMYNQDEPYFTLPNGIITHNCRLRSDKTNKYMNSLGSGSTRIGSLGVCTQNLPRLAYLSNGSIEVFKDMLRENIIMSQRINGVKRSILKNAIDKGMIPVYNLGYVDLKTQYSTTGVVGIYEALQTLGYDIKTEQGEAVAEDILKFISDVTDECSEEQKCACNVEQIPAENVAVKLAKKDKLLGYNDKYDIYSNQYIPLKDNDADMFTRIRLVANLDKYMSGGSILHININEEDVDTNTLVELASTMYKMGVVYFAFNKLLAECKDCDTVFTTDKDTFDKNEVTCPKCGSHNTECALRIVGFIRKFSSWSSERQAEGKQRKFYSNLVKGI